MRTAEPSRGSYHGSGRTEQQLGPVDLLVNNAGWHVPDSLGYAWEVDPEGWSHTLIVQEPQCGLEAPTRINDCWPGRVLDCEPDVQAVQRGT
jgi:hypothetical protein